MSFSDLRRRFISKPLFNYLKQSLPPLSATEQQALDAGDVWWDKDILSGNPDWSQLTELSKPRFSAAEQAFLDGPVAELCAMADDWAITVEHRSIPEPLWRFIKENGFLGMIIPEKYGGLGFCASAHAEVVMRLSMQSTALAVTVMVPNSLGPGELLLHFGTEAQKDYYLPRLARGEEIPCFGLTSPTAGSDASAMIDTGIVCKGEYEGKTTVGIRLNWHKRYITLGPVATLLGLAFKLYDPEHLLGDNEEPGITVALVPTHLPGINIGQRHYPAMQAFANGPNWGHDVFVPLDAIIGGPQRAGEGWTMLMTALAAGRSISLPSLSVGGIKLAAASSGAYARIREQFGVPVCQFEGIQAHLAQIGAAAYVFDATRQMTNRALDLGSKPAVISAIVKYHATDALRTCINHAMDIHGGKAICDGPSNYLGNVYRSVPIAITVEGANTLTRNLMIFGQGAVRCHPFLISEIAAAQHPDPAQGLEQFDDLLMRHGRFFVVTACRALGRSLTAGRFSNIPANTARRTQRYYRQLNRYSACLALISDIALMTLGGSLKRREMLSARLGDILSEIYLLSCVLQRYRWDAQPTEDLPLLRWCFDNGLHRIEQQMDEVLRNFPSRPLAWLTRLLVMPLGKWQKKPSDKLTRQVADLLVAATPTRERLIAGVNPGSETTGLGKVLHAFDQVVSHAELLRKVRQRDQASLTQAVADGTITTEEAELLQQLDALIASAIDVDSFTHELQLQ